MAIKHVRAYYERMNSDYMEMKRVLEEMENLSEDKSAAALANIDKMREQVRLLESNYKRLSYVMFLLNQPTNPKKKEHYEKSEKKKLDKIPKEDRMEAVIEENSETINSLKSYL